VARRPGPSQADVLRDRSARVPWRQAIVGAIRDRAGSGRAALPDRLEGAVYGQLVAEALGRSDTPASSSPGTIVGGARPGAGPAGGWSDESARMLLLLDRLLDGPADHDRDGGAAGAAGAGAAATTGIEPTTCRSPDEILAVPLVMRARDPRELVDAVARAWGGDGQPPVASALYALVMRRLIAGERGRADVLARAARDLRATLADRGRGAARSGEAQAGLLALDSLVARSGRSGGDPAGEGFRTGWDAFAGAAGYEQAVTRARGSGHDARTPAAIAGGLAGAYWGSSGIPPAWRRGLPAQEVVRSLVDRLVATDSPGWDGRPWRTSTASPLRVDPLDLTGLDGCASGAAGITFLPGRRYVGYHTGAQWRDLDTDAARLAALGVDVLLLLVEDRELARCRVTGIGDALAAHGVELIRFPIRDPLLPRDGIAFHATIASLLERVRDGGSIAIACRGGLDRAGMAGACLLREAGLSADEAIHRVQRARLRALTLPDQQAYVRDWPPRR
jgi:hypothetical protein